MSNERENYEGIAKKGVKKEWCEYIRHRCEFSMAICRSLASDIEAFMNEVRGKLKEGQLSDWRTKLLNKERFLHRQTSAYC
ncbi:MAG: hypothetical protein N2V76_10150 [Methanophagales archaeon]|nr:hypothetical protein [Methanophagales archaeon]